MPVRPVGSVTVSMYRNGIRSVHIGILQYAIPTHSRQENLPLNITNFLKLKFGANSQ